MSSISPSFPGMPPSLLVQRLGLAASLILGITLAVPAVLAQTAPGQGTWTKVAPMLRQQNEATTVVLDGRIYVMGGFTINSDEPIARVQIYDVAGDQWSLGTPLPEPVHHAGAALVGGKIYQIGGFHNAFGQRDPIDAVWAFDPATRQWERRAPLPSPRGAMVVAAIGDLIYAAGGEHRRPPGSPVPKDAAASYEPTADLVVYDPKADRWQQLPSMRHPRDHAFVGSINGRLYVAGGRDRPQYGITATEEYDPVARDWTERAPMPTGRSGGTAAVLGGKLYTFGGEGNDASPLGVFDEVEAYDPVSNSWIKFGPMLLPRHSLSAATVGDRIYLLGGSTAAALVSRATIRPALSPNLPLFAPPPNTNKTAHVDAFQPR